ncbi:multidrug ABC transporter ATP-binding protein, partial [Paenibacillus sepulcri]|nr:multidrug ABC transporter ATP-binding protein [Paenibacillus sepulcri]
MSERSEENEHREPQAGTPAPPPPPIGMAGRGGFGAGRRGGPVVKPKNLGATLKRMWTYVGSERKRLTVIFAIILVDALITLTGPYLIGMAVDAMSGAGGGKAVGQVDFSLLQV